MAERVAVYAGSFDPITNGHVEMVQRGLVLFDRIVVLVANNIRKKTMFTVEERVQMAKRVFAQTPQVEVAGFEGLLATYMQDHKLHFLLRGLRAVSDFESEFQMAMANHHLAEGEVESVFLMASEEHLYISSSMVREVFLMGGDVERWVPYEVLEALQAKPESKMLPCPSWA